MNFENSEKKISNFEYSVNLLFTETAVFSRFSYYFFPIPGFRLPLFYCECQHLTISYMQETSLS